MRWKPLVEPNIARILVYIAPGARYAQKNARRLGELAPTIESYDLPIDTIAPGSSNWLKIVRGV